MSEVKQEVGVAYPIERELTDRLETVMHEYDERLSTVAVIGILELLKLDAAGVPL